MKSRSVLFILMAIITSMALNLNAQEMNIGYDPNGSIPLDPDVIYGTLDNGLTYYIRENARPEDRAEFYLVCDVGAIQENPDQNGLAHFCEHMAFNGTEQFEKKDIINYLQSIGMKFGPEINAFTSQEVTTYMLQKVPIDVPENIDTSLMILHDWAGKVSFENEEIDAERGVIHEEWRTGMGAQRRMMTKADQVIYKGSKYADHTVIGEIDIIDTFAYQTLRDFYNDWYRPDLQAIVAVGDFDAADIEQKIKEQFSKLPKRKNPRAKEQYEVPDHKETFAAVITDKEAQYSMMQLYYMHPAETSRNMEYYRQTIVENLYATMLNARINELTMQEDPPFIYGASYYSNLVETRDGYVVFAIAKDDKMLHTLETMLIENERVKQHGFTTTEFERAKAEVLSSVEKEFKERNKKESDDYVWVYYSHFLNDEPAPGIEFDYAFTTQMLDGITLEEVNTLAGDWIIDENRSVVFMVPEKEGLELPTEEEIINLVDGIDQVEVEPYVDKVNDQPLIAVEPTPSEVIKKGTNKKLESIEWTFENGVKAVIKTTDFKDDEILMDAFSYGGTSIATNEQLASAQMASGIANQSGIGSFDIISLEKKLAGQIVNVSPVISGTWEGFSGSCAPKDLETMLQLVYLYFTEPRWDETAYNATIARYEGIIENKSLNPSSALWDSVSVIQANYNPRVVPMSMERLAEVNHKTAFDFYLDRFGDPGSFTFYFVGNIDPDEVKPLFEKYLGGLPAMKRNESWKDNNIRPPKGEVKKIIKRDMEVPKATVYVSYNGTYDYDDYQNRIDLSAVCDILDIRYTETIREEQGGTYGVAIYPRQFKYPYMGYQVVIYFDCDPENADKLKSIVYEEIDKLKTEGPQPKDLKGVKENKIKSYKENLKKNRYWLRRLKNVDYEKIEVKDLMKYEKYVDNLTQESIQQAAKTFFADDVIEVVLLPTSTEGNKKNPTTEK